MKDEKYLKIYNEIFYAPISHIEFLIKNNVFNSECVEYICQHLLYVKKSCEQTEKEMRFFQHYPKAKQLISLIDKQKTLTDKAEIDKLQTQIDEIKKLFDVSAEPAVIQSTAELKSFLILLKQLWAVDQIKLATEPVTTQTSISQTLKQLNTPGEFSVVQLTIWAKQIINDYFLSMGMDIKPKVCIGDVANQTLFDLSSQLDQPILCLSKDLFKPISSKDEKQEFVSAIIKNCAVCYSQMVLTDVKHIKKNPEAALVGLDIVNAQVLKKEQNQKLASSFAGSEVDRVVYRSKNKFVIVPIQQSEQMQFVNYVNNLIVAKINKKSMG